VKNWFSINLGDAMLAAEALECVETKFAAHYHRRETSNDTAIFTRHESEGQLHCDLIIYLSPALAELARELNAKTCKTPSPHSLSLLAGNKGAWLRLFPEYRR
jgi:hypothetical protein